MIGGINSGYMNFNYQGSYAVTRNTKDRNAFPYSVKVEGFGSAKNKKSLFNFAYARHTKR